MPATFQTYYTSAPMRARPFLFALTLSDRSDGKTFNIKEESISDWRAHRWTSIYMRRVSKELPESLYTTFYNELQAKYPEKYGDLKFKYSKQGVQIWDEEAEKWSQLIYFIPLTMAAKLKSTLDVGPIHKVFFDEYVPLEGRYLKDEMILLLEFWKSIDRDRDQTLIHCYGNKIDLFNPFFDFFDIPVFDQNKKKIRSYRDNTVGVEIYINKEHREARKQQRSASLFAGTSYDDYAQGGTLAAYDLKQCTINKAYMRPLASFKSSVGEGTIWTDAGADWYISVKEKRREGMLIVDKMITLQPNDQRQIVDVRLADFARLFRVKLQTGAIAYESPAAFHAFEPILRRARAL